jgi:hypothetical protein
VSELVTELLGFSCCGKLVVEEGIVLEPRGRGTSTTGSRNRATASEDVTVDTSVGVTVYCRVWLRAVSKSPKI